MLKTIGLFFFFGGNGINWCRIFLELSKKVCHIFHYSEKGAMELMGIQFRTADKAGGKWLQWREERKRKVQGPSNGKA